MRLTSLKKDPVLPKWMHGVLVKMKSPTLELVPKI